MIKAFLFLNNGTHTYRSYSYNTTDALHLTISSPDLFPYCSWKVVDYVGRDHYPILIELDYDVKAYGNNNIYWNFKKANWTLFEKNLSEQLQKNPITEDLENEWFVFKHSIFMAAEGAVPRDARIELNKINAEIKREYRSIKQSNWQDLCKSLDYKTPNTRLWRLAKKLDKNTTTGGKYEFYHWKGEQKTGRATRKLIRSCRVPASNELFNDPITSSELLYAIQQLDFKKSPGPDGSVLSPTLFSLYLTGIERVVSPCQIGILADDIIVWDHNSDLTKLETTLNDTLEKIQHFADEHKLAFNTTKSISSLFTTNRHLFNYQPKSFLKEQLLESTKTPTYLGFTLDTKINCSKHINRLCEKGRKRLQLLKYISGRDWGSRCRHTQDHLYCSYKANP
ncbi:putative RNA-directed DNA polymerase from transposon BS [Caerostris extrusa]|uniref:RNA-directed DNA polymerase from transposon BS n=1 Tax=Caerostris extrusa TaxID=172846 RepID=A0AAV4R893_CAEEX|nr:putative RNA-directed DNA polymerase from transposon BS [Caerostris extrusa]